MESSYSDMIEEKGFFFTFFFTFLSYYGSIQISYHNFFLEEFFLLAIFTLVLNINQMQPIAPNLLNWYCIDIYTHQ